MLVILFSVLWFKYFIKYSLFLKFGWHYSSKRFVDLCCKIAPRAQITMMKDVSRMKSDYQDEHLYAKAQDILYDEEFYEYARFPKVLFSIKFKN